VDDDGRALILHGVNMEGESKDTPDHLPLLTRDEVTRLARGWGFDFVRFLIFWDAIEPAPGTFDDAYLDAVETRLDWFAEEGVHVVLDMHQDVYARRFCCDGAPEWAIRDDGLPFTMQALWSANYLQPAATRAFDNFWDVTGPNADLQEHYAMTWAHVAERFRDHPAVLGYDVINEPFPGSDFDTVEAIVRRSPRDGGRSKTHDETKLGPFYARMIAAIRTVDPDNFIFVEPRFGAPANGSPTYLPPLADPRAADGTRAARIVWAPHLYSTATEAAGAYSPDDRTLEAWAAERLDEYARYAQPLVIGEFGGAWGWDDYGVYVADALDTADSLGAGWAWWSFGSGGATSWSIFDRTTGDDNPVAELLVRPYPRAIAGAPVSWSVDRATRRFELVFRAKDGVTGATEIYVPAARHYATGFDVAMPSDPDGAWSQTFDADREILSIVAAPGVAEHRIVVTAR
jgi:endoglycosylceramidase